MKSTALLLALCVLAFAAKIIAADSPKTIPAADYPSAKTDSAIKVRILEGHTGSVLAVVFSPDGKTLATGSRDQSIRLWDAQTGELKTALKGHSGDLECIRYSPDGKTLASSSHDMTIHLWDTATNKTRLTLEGHTAEVDSVTFSPDGKFV